jgi:hypothetical protein
MYIRKIKELSVEILQHSDGTYYVKIEQYTIFPKYKESIAETISFSRVSEPEAKEIIKKLELIPDEREDKSAINWRGKLWQQQQKFRSSRMKK